MTVTSEVPALSSMWSAKAFEPQIHHIRFPRFRNLEDNLQIDFGFPITAIVGPNGTNKSSILRALQGCPDYENIGKYWFGTAMDVISTEERHRFVHGRWSTSAQEVVEIIKTRIRRTGADAETFPDYFEPSRPIARDGMSIMPAAPIPMPADRTATRWKAIEKSVLYIDFRAEISAFDKYFFHNEYRPRASNGAKHVAQQRGVKTLIQERSSRLKRILDQRTLSYKPGGREWILAQARPLTDSERSEVSFILGRTYSNIEIITHRAFEVSGVTARLHTTGFSYSEAWAGSGEFAAVQLVTAIESASEKSLVLLDEPEVSLHPGAQRRLLDYLARKSKTKRLQIVFATHSPVLLEELPASAIKVLELHPISGRVVLRGQSSSSAEAFVALDHRFQRRSVLVEDALAREIVLRALRTGGALLVDAVDVKPIGGGASMIRTRLIPSFAAENRLDALVLLDGDQRPPSEVPDPKHVAPANLKSAVEEALVISNVTGVVFANTGGATDAELRLILAWIRSYVRYLPGMQPDQWLRTCMGEAIVGTDEKAWWRLRTIGRLKKLGSEDVTGPEILEEQKRVLADLPDETPEFVEIRDAITLFIGVAS